MIASRALRPETRYAPYAVHVVRALLLITGVGRPGMLGAGLASAAATPESLTVESFGRDMPSCHEWSDACVVCTRTGSATAACSLPGIACQPQAITCRDNQAK